MRSILDTCTPRPDLLAGTFNPEMLFLTLIRVSPALLDNAVPPVERRLG
jgi:hypothetical protein